jgi:hypothetical protein
MNGGSQVLAKWPRPQRSVLIVAVVLASLLGATALTARGGQETLAAPPITVGVDVDPAGNSSTSLGTIEFCKEVSEGQSFDVDIFVQDSSDLAGFQLEFVYEPDIVSVEAKDQDFFLGVPGLEIGDPMPDRDGRWIYAYARPPGGGGSGVLVRLTLKAVGTGTSLLLLEGVLLSDKQTKAYPPDNIAAAVIAVGEACPEELPPLPTAVATVPPVAPATPTPESTPTAEAPVGGAGLLGSDDDGFPVWAMYLIGVAAALMLGGIGTAATVVWRRRR